MEGSGWGSGAAGEGPPPTGFVLDLSDDWVRVGLTVGAEELKARVDGLIPDHRARQVRADELADWDLVLAMTSSHYAALSRLRDRARPGGRAPEIRMFRDFDPQCAHLPEGPGRDKDLPDPWYGDYGDFVDTLAVIERSTPALVDYVRP